MKVALAHDHLNQIGGAERVVLALHKIWPDAPLYTLVHDQKKIADFFDDLRIRTSFVQKLPLSLSHLRWYLSLLPAAMESFDLSEYDVLVSSASAFGKGVIAPPAAVHICYCHTPTRYLWSDANTYVADTAQGPIIKKILPLFLSRLRQWDQLAATRVDYFVANSEFIASRIKRYYKRESQVIYPPVDVNNYPRLPKKDYFILVSRLRPYKKVDLVIQAFNRLRLPLVIVGDGEEEQKLKKMSSEYIKFSGRVSEDDKKRLLAGARGFIHPQEEDFGIAAVEAMAAGTPVIAFHAGGVKETVAPGVSGLFFEEQTWQSLAHAVILSTRQSFNFDEIRNHAQKFSQARFQREMSAFVEEKYLEARDI